MDMKVFVDTDSDIRLARRLKRDILERNRDIVGVIKQYNKFVKPAMDEFIAPSMNFADVVVPRGSDNLVAISLIIDHVKLQLKERGFIFRELLATASHDGPMPSTLHVLPSTNQVRGKFDLYFTLFYFILFVLFFFLTFIYICIKSYVIYIFIYIYIFTLFLFSFFLSFTTGPRNAYHY